MANITVQFATGEPHSYENVPDDVTPDQIEARALQDFPDRKVSHLDRSAVKAEPKKMTADDIPGTPKQPEPAKEPSLYEKGVGAIEAGLATVSGLATGAIAAPYGVAKDIYKRTTGQAPAGVSQADKYAGELMDKAPAQPKSETGKEYLGKVGEVMQNIPAIIPEAGMVKTGAQSLKMEGERFANVPKVGAEVTPETTMKQNVFAEGRKKGYVATPTSVTDTALGATAESITNKTKLTQQSSIKNSAARANDIRTSDLGLPEGSQVTVGELESVRGKLQDSKTAIVSELPEIKTSDEFRSDAKKLLQTYPYLKENHPSIGLGGTVETKEAMEVVRYLRSKADEKLSVPVGKKISPENQAAGKNAFDIANKIEAEIENQIQLSNKPELLDKFKEARKQTAQTYAVQAAMNPATGDISGLKLATMYGKNPDVFTGGLKRAAEHAKAFPADNRDLARVGGHPPLSAWDFLVAGGSAMAGHPMVAMAEISSRTLLPKIAMSDFIQNRLVKNPKFNNYTMKQMDQPTIVELKKGAAAEVAQAKQKAQQATERVLQEAAQGRASNQAKQALIDAARQASKAAESQALMEAGKLRGENMVIDEVSRRVAKEIGKHTQAEIMAQSGKARGEEMIKEIQRQERQAELAKRHREAASLQRQATGNQQ